jgi:UPF0716 family protein affecting phage T7 exclusion
MNSILIILILVLLTSCIGPALFTIAGFKVTLGTAVTVPAKIEAYDKHKKEKETNDTK